MSEKIKALSEEETSFVNVVGDGPGPAWCRTNDSAFLRRDAGSGSRTATVVSVSGVIAAVNER